MRALLFLLLAVVYFLSEASGNEGARQVPGRRFKIRPLKYSRKYFEGMLGLLPQKATLRRGSSYSSVAQAFANVVPPPSFSWVDQAGTVTSVKDQGGCGSCYAFAGTGAIESMLVIWNAKAALNLSEQQIVDCSRNFGNLGCNGGLMEYVYSYIKANGGQKLEKVYPYRGNAGACRNPTGALYAVGITYANIPYGNEEELKKMVYTMGPVSIGVHANTTTFFQYAGGIYDDPECAADTSRIDHAVLLVGYGEENGVPYWIIKNSWNTWWGENGYMKMIRGKAMCRIGGMGSVPEPAWLANRLVAGEDVRHKWRVD